MTSNEGNNMETKYGNPISDLSQSYWIINQILSRIFSNHNLFPSLLGVFIHHMQNAF